MQHYFRRLEACRHRPVQRALSRLGIDRTGHGWDGWLQTEKAIPKTALRDRQLRDAVVACRRGHVCRERPAAAAAGAGSSRAPAIPTTSDLIRAERRRRALHAADHPRPPADGHARARAGDRGTLPGPAPRRARRAGDARAVRREQPGHRRRVSQGRTAVPGACQAQRGRRASAGKSHASREVILAGRCLQHAAAADALGHRAARHARALRHRGAGRPAGRRPQPAGPLRGRRRQPHDLRALGAHWKGRASPRAIRCIEAGRPAATASMPPTAPAWR